MIKSKIENCLKKAIRKTLINAGLKQTNTDWEIFIPEQKQFGHYSTNAALKLAKELKKPPIEIAENLRSEILNLKSDLFEKIEVAPPGFINFWLSKKTLVNELKRVIKKDKNYGRSNIGRNKTIVIDYSAPNIAKPMNVGHLRSTIIGQTLVNLFRFQNYRVIGDNHLGDWGTQFGALLLAYKKWGDKKQFEKKPVDYLVKLYVRFHKASDKNKELLAAAREETKKLQLGDKENLKLWRLFTKESLKDFNKIYKRLGIKFDYALGESFYQPMLKAVVQEALKKGVAKIDDGAVKIFFNESLKLPALIIQKSDGSYLYSTTDLATIKYRLKKWRPEKILYVVANEQTLHFEQVFNAALLLNYGSKNLLEHIKFGMILGETGKKMSTRRGQFIKLEALLDKAVSEAAKINKKVAESVGIGAVKYRILSQERLNDIVFDWKQMLNLKGNSSPYLQYTYARLKSVLRKARTSPKKIDFSLLEKESEKLVMRQILYFPDIISRAIALRETNILADYLFKLSNLLNNFYESEPILKAPKSLAENRLNLIKASAIILKNGLNLLGIEVLEKM
jgi:arginyl-tRNA synthetase